MLRGYQVSVLQDESILEIYYTACYPQQTGLYCTITICQEVDLMFSILNTHTQTHTQIITKRRGGNFGR